MILQGYKYHKKVGSICLSSMLVFISISLANQSGELNNPDREDKFHVTPSQNANNPWTRGATPFGGEKRLKLRNGKANLHVFGSDRIKSCVLKKNAISCIMFGPLKIHMYNDLYEKKFDLTKFQRSICYLGKKGSFCTDENSDKLTTARVSKFSLVENGKFPESHNSNAKLTLKDSGYVFYHSGVFAYFLNSPEKPECLRGNGIELCAVSGPMKVVLENSKSTIQYKINDSEQAICVASTDVNFCDID